jgi:hypothetical protein
MDTTDNETMRLPEWKHCLDKMIDLGIDYGAIFETKWLAQTMRMDPESMHFSLAISEIRKALRAEGKWLSGEGQNGARLVIRQPQDNYREVARLSRAAQTALVQGTILGTSTPVELLDANERRRHEAITERIAKRAALMGRRQANIVKKLTTNTEE